MKRLLFAALALAVSTSAAHAGSVAFLMLDGAGDTITVSMDTTDVLQGWSWGVCNDADIDPISVGDGSTTATVNNGSAPDFNTINLFPNAGWTVGVVISFLGAASLPAGAGYEMNVATYDVSALTPGVDSLVCTCDQTLGSPATANVVVVSGASFPPAGADGECGAVSVPVAEQFIRGDCNDDGSVNIADGVFNINALFLGGPTNSCTAACDANDDGTVDSSDSIYTWNFLLLGGPPPAAPYPDCGGDSAGCGDTCP